MDMLSRFISRSLYDLTVLTLAFSLDVLAELVSRTTYHTPRKKDADQSQGLTGATCFGKHNSLGRAPGTTFKF